MIDKKTGMRIILSNLIVPAIELNQGITQGTTIFPLSFRELIFSVASKVFQNLQSTTCTVLLPYGFPMPL